MSANKTQPTNASVAEFLAGVSDATRRQECQTLLAMMRELTGAEPVMWGTSIVGFGQFRYQSRSGRTGDWFRLGFSPRKRELSLYLSACGMFDEAKLARLGQCRHGVGCLYIKRLAEVDLGVLRELLAAALAALPPTGD